jgi:SAM-dependent methyltransferase
MVNPPSHDQVGLHILDPKDSLGFKSSYITLLQEKALNRYLPPGTGGIAVDLGCGYGRLTPLLIKKGWKAIGIDPSQESLEYAQEHFPGPDYRQGGLPNLPIEYESASLILIQNVLRALKIMGKLDVVHGLGRYVAPGGKIFLVENIRAGHPDYIPEAKIVEMMAQEDMFLVKRVPIRSARWWVIYLIRYGLIPRRFLNAIAEWELVRMERKKGAPRFQYWNVLFVFEKMSAST